MTLRSTGLKRGGGAKREECPTGLKRGGGAEREDRPSLGGVLGNRLSLLEDGMFDSSFVTEEEKIMSWLSPKEKDDDDSILSGVFHRQT